MTRREWDAEVALALLGVALGVVLVVAALLQLGGCATVAGIGNRTEKPRQLEAIDIVWRRSFGRDDAAPRVIWVEGAELGCTDPVSERPGFWQVAVTGRQCREGLTESPWEVFVSWHEGDTFSDTALCHEGRHAADARELRPDGLHLGPQWKPGGAVDMCNAALAKEGL